MSIKVAVWIMLVVVTVLSAQTDDVEAKKHYRVGIVALENNDLSIAADQFRQALKLAPNNALIYFQLAIICSKQDDPIDGLSNLKKARERGLPEKEASAAEELEAKLTYALEERKQLSLIWLFGQWHAGSDYSSCSSFDWDLIIDNETKESLTGKLVYTWTYNCNEKYNTHTNSWDARISNRGFPPGSARGDFKYIGCSGDCSRFGVQFNSFQADIEKRGNRQIFVSGQENGDKRTKFSILDRR